MSLASDFEKAKKEGEKQKAKILSSKKSANTTNTNKVNTNATKNIMSQIGKSSAGTKLTTGTTTEKKTTTATKPTTNNTAKKTTVDTSKWITDPKGSFLSSQNKNITTDVFGGVHDTSKNTNMLPQMQGTGQKTGTPTTKSIMAQIGRSSAGKALSEKKDVNPLTYTAKKNEENKYKLKDGTYSGNINRQAEITAQKYGFDPDSFSFEDLAKWAEKNNYDTIKIAGGYEFTPKKDGGILGIGGKKLSTETNDTEFESLYALASGNQNRKYTEEHPVKSQLYKVLTTPQREIVSVMQDVHDTAKAVTGQKVSPYQRGHLLNTMANDTQSINDQKVTEKYGTLGHILFEAGTGFAENALRTVTTSALGAKTLKAKSATTSALMGANVMSNSFVEGKQKGYSDGKALAMGFASGLIEYATEKVSIETIMKDPKSFVGQLGKSFISEGSEEMASDLLNTALDSAVNGKDSDFNKTVQEYKNQGCNDRVALWKAIANKAGETLESGLVGGLSGMGFGATDYAMNHKMYSYQNAVNTTNEKNISKYFKNADTIDTQKLALYNTQLENMENKGLKGKDIYNETLQKKADILSKIERTQEKEKIYLSSDAKILQKKFQNVDPLKVQYLADVNRQIADFENHPGYFNPKSSEYSSEKISEYARLVTNQFTAVNEIVHDEITNKYDNIEFNDKDGCFNLDDYAVKTISDTANSFGIKVVFDSKLNVSGIYEKGKITLNPNLDGSDNVLNAYAHELSHHAESSKMYKGLREDISNKVISEWARTKGYKGQAEMGETYRRAYSKYYEKISDKELNTLVRNEIVADYLAELFTKDSDYLENLMENNSGMKKAYRKVSDYFYRIADKLKLTNEQERYVRKLGAKFEKALNTADVNEVQNKGTRYKIGEISGKEGDYGVGVYLDTNIFDGVKSRYWNKVLTEFVYNNLAGKPVSAYDQNGKREVVFFAEKNERVQKDTIKNNHKVIDKLARVKGNTNMLSVVHIEELLETSKYFEENTENTHGWLDKNGWEFRKTYVQDRNGNIYETTLNIAKAKDGRKILYGLSNTKKVETGGSVLNANAEGRAHILNSDNIVSQKSENVNSENKNLYENDKRYKISAEEIREIQGIGRKSINDFSSSDIKKTEKFARQYYREMGTKSPFFRAWFGDWRANDNTQVRVANEKGNARGIVKNKDTGWDIQISGKVFSESKHAGIKNQTALPYLDYINSIAENSVLLDTYTIASEKAKSENSALMHSLYAIADMGNGKEVVKLFVEELNDVNSDGTIKRAYQLQNITSQQLKSSEFRKNLSSIIPTADTYSVSQLFEIVKRFDKNFQPKVSSKVVNGDGSPKVVYHGTRTNFNTFKLQNEAEFGRALGDGFYFTENYKRAFRYANGITGKDHGGNIMAVHLDIKNPFYITNENKTHYGTELENGLADGKYDGVIDTTNGTYLVFKPEQIKSATDNAGTFDKGNPDIRYKLSSEEIEESRLEKKEEDGNSFSYNETVNSILNDRSVYVPKETAEHFWYAKKINGGTMVTNPKTFVKSLVEDGISNSKDLTRNIEAMAGKSTYVKKMLENDFLKPFTQSKKTYTANMYSMLNSYFTMCQTYGIEKGSIESQATQWYGEGVKEDGETPYTLADLKKDCPDTWYKVVAFEKYNRNVYDSYIDKINTMLIRIYPNLDGMLNRMDNDEQQLINDMKRKIKKAGDNEEKIKEIEESYKYMFELYAKMKDEMQVGKRLRPRKDYYRHFREVNTFMDIFDGNFEINPEMAQVSQDTRPKTKWESFLQHRMGNKNTADAVKSMLDYIPNAEYKLAFDPIINDFRIKTKAIAMNTTEEKNANKAIVYLTNFTNDIAGKTSLLDRGIKNERGRNAFKVFETIDGRVKKNAILYNFSSSLVQVSNLPNMMFYVKNPKYMVKGGKTYFDYFTGKNKAMLQSSFLQERYMGDLQAQFNNTAKENAEYWGGKMLEFGDKFVAQYVWSCAYEQAKGKKIKNAVEYADDITRKVVAGRGVGEVPITQKSLLVRMFMPFNVETNNTWVAMKNAVKKKDLMGLTMFFIMCHGINAFFKKVIGRDVLPDIIENFKEAYEVFCDDEGNAVSDTTEFTAMMVGRIISYGPYANAVKTLFANEFSNEESLNKFFGEGYSRYGMSNMTLSAIFKPIIQGFEGKNIDYSSYITNFVTPFGGKQISKTAKALTDYGVIPGYTLSTKRGIKKIPTDVKAYYKNDGSVAYLLNEEPTEKAKAFLFGTSTTKNAKDYYAQNSVSYNENSTKAMRELMKKGIAPSVYDTYRKKLKEEGKTNTQNAIKVLDGMNLTDKQKNALFSATNENWKKSYWEAKTDNVLSEITTRLNNVIENGNETQKIRAKQLKKVINQSSLKNEITFLEKTICREKETWYNEDSEAIINLRKVKYKKAKQLYGIYNGVIKTME